jgi:hypothetical protein
VGLPALKLTVFEYLDFSIGDNYLQAMCSWFRAVIAMWATLLAECSANCIG